MSGSKETLLSSDKRSGLETATHDSCNSDNGSKMGSNPTGTKKGTNSVIVNTDSDMPSSWGCKTRGFEIQTRDIQSMPMAPPPPIPLLQRASLKDVKESNTEKITTVHRVWIVVLCCVIFPSAWEPRRMCLNIIVLKVAFLIWKFLVCYRHLNCICRMVIMPEWILWRQNWLKDCLMMWPQAMKPFYVELGYQVIIITIIIIIIIKTIIIIRVAIRHWRSENSPFTVQNSPTNVR